MREIVKQQILKHDMLCLSQIKSCFICNVYQAKRNFSVLIFAPTFYTKVTENLCSGRVFFSSDKFRLFN